MTINPNWLLLAACVVAGMLLVWLDWRRLSLTSLGRRLGVVLLLALVALQPRLSGSDSSTPPTAVDVLLVIDRTTSMGATDWSGTQPRLTGVAEDVAALVATMPAARFCVVAIDNEARVVTPWTTDGASVETLARTIGWREEGYGTGSDISVGNDLIHGLLTRTAAERPQASRYLVYFGDGEQTAAKPAASFESLRPLLADSLVLGYGTDTGATMAIRPGTDELVKRDGVAQRSRLDEAALRRMAGELGGAYEHRTSPGGLTFWPTTGAGLGDVSGPATGLPPGWWPGLGAAALLLVDLSLTARGAARMRSELRP